MVKNLLICADHDRFWSGVTKELEQCADVEIQVWLGQKNDASQNDNAYFSIDPYETFHLKGFSLKGDWSKVDIERVSLLDYYNFMKIYDRADVDSNLSFSERNHLFFSHLSFWLSLLSERSIDCIVYSNIPHMPDSYGLMIAAKLLGLPMVIVNVTPFSGVVFLTSEIYGDMLTVGSNVVKPEENLKLLESYIRDFGPQSDKEIWYMKQQREREEIGLLRRLRNAALSKRIPRLQGIVKALANRVFGEKYLSIKRHAGVYDGLQKSLFRELIVLLRWRFYRKRLENELSAFESSEVPDRYVYFPLHYQPEATTAPGAGFFSDQQLIIDLVSSALPDGVSLVVKEHPTQLYKSTWGFSGRHPGYWEKIFTNGNVVLVSRELDSKKLIKNSIGVVTATGTAGFEALLQGKPCFVFGHPWYVEHPGVARVNFVDAQQALRDQISGEGSISSHNDLDELNEFIDKISKYLIQCDVHGYSGGMLDRDPRVLAEAISQYV